VICYRQIHRGSFLKPGATSVWRILYPLHEIVIHIFTKAHILFCLPFARYTLVFYFLVWPVSSLLSVHNKYNISNNNKGNGKQIKNSTMKYSNRGGSPWPMSLGGPQAKRGKKRVCTLSKANRPTL
jgi:hypothetical protein